MSRYTKHDINYHMSWAGRTVIPAGTKVRPATNLPHTEGEEAKYWCEPWEGMSETAKGWGSGYGFLVYESDLQRYSHFFTVGLEIDNSLDADGEDVRGNEALLREAFEGVLEAHRKHPNGGIFDRVDTITMEEKGA